jgi:vacuolar-type H+-ATPase subunit E/Vma4
MNVSTKGGLTMDQVFVKLVEILEKWSEEGEAYSTLLLLKEIIEYGIEKGVLQGKNVGSNKSDESVMFRAACGFIFLRSMFGENPGSVLKMTREQHEGLIRDIFPMAEAIMETALNKTTKH